MGDYAGYARDFLGIVFYLYIGICATALMLALWLPKGKESKMAAAILVIVLASILPIKAFLVYREEKQAADAFKVRYDKAKALFDERCKSAGEKVYKTVENVDVIYLSNPRPKSSNADRADQNWKFAGLPGEYGGDAGILSFLLWEHMQKDQRKDDPDRATRSYLNDNLSEMPGYKFVDVKQSDGSIERNSLASGYKLRVQVLESPPVIYEVINTDISSQEDREHWIAGIKVQVRNNKSNETLAEKVWYAFEPGLGDTDGSRSPWGFALVCDMSGYGNSPTRYFVDQILKPSKR